MENGSDDPIAVGDILINGTGAIVLDYAWRTHRGGEAVGKHGVVIALLRENPHDKYVVWGFVKEPDQVSHTFHGDYFSDLVEAINCFVERRMRLLNG